jgi:HK97 family phage prohead protease
MDNNLYFSGYASMFNTKDYTNDIIINGAFKNIPSTVPLLLEHSHSNIIGKISNIIQDTQGLYVNGNLLNSTINKHNYNLSIGFIVNNFYINKQTNTRYITNLTLVEISLVKNPANKDAKILKTYKYN